ncbi:MAG: hypothetical protein AMXMBFR46_21370 [Acidimicrobiia bacterium]
MSGPRSGRGFEIDDVLARTDLAQLLDDLAQPAAYRTRGRRWHCPVPGHDDHHASVTMHTDHRGHERWRCWSGDDTHRGDAIDLVVTTQHMSRANAIQWLADRAGLHPDRPLPPPRRKARPAPPAFVPLRPIVVRYIEACEQLLWTPTGAPIRAWLHDRGFTDPTLRANRVGADPGRHTKPRAQGLPYGASPAATFPALAPDATLRYVQARYLHPAGSDKYDNPAATLGSNPRLAWTRTTGLTQAGVLVVCEGIPDALTAAQAGYTSVAILGSQSPDHAVAARLAIHTEQHDQRVVAVIDADPAGRTWGTRLGELLAEHDTALTVVEPPAGLDLNAWSLHDTTW